MAGQKSSRIGHHVFFFSAQPGFSILLSGLSRQDPDHVLHVTMFRNRPASLSTNALKSCIKSTVLWFAPAQSSEVNHTAQ